ncbi:ribbon-helix-helix domain-containing protein [Tetragenococcus muriaticus]|uniref:Ribbon-helix-helix protein CopG domain-containing protein n=1 Tax=Tetragenococcus muriaticus 3MR10-3 TaxID=1302648 RepID=A0A091BTN6_9ENTE|nr:ribbon-helix-helix protein, CopG family [Tetragenococcus muriaticus]KFN89011.1 hypothetical protein TMU3MR103_2277 [Tetragenococcus muriaticus 3MR10-3]
MSKRVQVTLKEDIFEKLESIAKELGISKSAVIALSIQEYERKHDKKESN